jgi:hypothetical protein
MFLPQSLPSCRPSGRRRLLLGGVLTSTIVLGGLVVASPAFASPSTVSNEAELTQAFQTIGTGTGTITIDPSWDDLDDVNNDVQTTPDDSNITLDLNGQDVDLVQLVLGTGSTLTITDSASPDNPGELTADNSSGNDAGIAIGDGATLDVAGASVTGDGGTDGAGIGAAANDTIGGGQLIADEGSNVVGNGGTNGAGIGGGEGAAAVSVTVNGASVNGRGGDYSAGIGSGSNGAGGSLTATGDASVFGTGGTGAAGIGGGEGADGIPVQLGGSTNAHVEAGGADLSGPAGPGANAVGAGQGAGTFGSLSIDGGAALRVDSGALLIPSGIAVTNAGEIELTASTTLTNAGTLTNTGTVDGAGDVSSTGTLTNSTDGYVDNSGALHLAGTVSNAGSIDVQGAGTSSAALDITSDGDLSVESGATLAVTGDVTNEGGISTDGTLSVGPTGTIENENDLYVNDGGTLDIAAGGVVTNDDFIDVRGTVSGAGTVVNNGTVNPEAGSTISVAAIKGYNYDVTLDPNGGTPGASTHQRVYAPYLSVDSANVPTATRAGQVFGTFNTRADGTGTDAYYNDLDTIAGTSSTGAPVSLTLYAQYGVPAAFTGTTVPNAALGRAYDQAVPATGDGQKLYYVDAYDADGNAIPGLPAGLSLDPSTGHITGTPTDGGTFTFRVSVSNEFGYADQYFTIAIAGAPAFATTSLPGGTAGSAYSTTLSASGGATFSVVGSSLPAGLSLSSAGVLSGTPTTAGNTTFTVRATNAFGTTDEVLTLGVGAAPAVAKPAAPTLPSIAKKTVKFGHSLSIAVTANSTVPVTYSEKGDLPKGVTFNTKTGVISGVPAESGTFTAVVTATSAAGSAHTTVTIDVPAIKQLIKAKPVAATAVGAKTVPIRVPSLKKHEKWRITVNGKTVATGTMKKAGTLKTSIHLAAVKHDVVRHIVISTSRKVTDPAERAATQLTVTSLSAKKVLSSTHSRAAGKITVTVHKLAAHESVVVKQGTKTVAKGKANASGVYTLVSKKLAKGTHHLTVHGADATRSVKLTVKPAAKK